MHGCEARIADDPQLKALFGEVEARMQFDAAHDVGHLLRVADWTLKILREEKDAEHFDERLAIAAALLHDIVNVPKTDAARAGASERSASVASEILLRFGFVAEETSLVAAAIRDHSYTRGRTPESALGRALQDADRLEALGAIGICRCIATGVRFGAAFFDPQDPWATNRPLDDARFSVDHFFTKLLRLPPTLLTRTGRAEAFRRAGAMHAFLGELGSELRAPYETESSVTH